MSCQKEMNRNSNLQLYHQDKTQLIASPCCFCGGRVFNYLFIAEDSDGFSEQFTLLECAGCQIVRTSPLLSDNQLALYYSNSYYGARKKKFKSFFEKFTLVSNYYRARSLLKRLPGNSGQLSRTSCRILDVGCGRATLLRMLSQLGCECFGIERKDFSPPEGVENIHFYCEQLEKIGFETDSYDMAILWHSLEHLSNPAVTLKEIRRILKPEGLLVIATPNFDSFQREIFNAQWFHLDLPRHTHHFGLATLEEQLKLLGFTIKSTSTFNLEQNSYGFVQSLLNKLFPWITSNRLYSMLKEHKNIRLSSSLIVWLILAGLILPLALVESIVTGFLETGATVIIYASGSDK